MFLYDGDCDVRSWYNIDDTHGYLVWVTLSVLWWIYIPSFADTNYFGPSNQSQAAIIVMHPMVPGLSIRTTLYLIQQKSFINIWAFRCLAYQYFSRSAKFLIVHAPKSRRYFVILLLF